MDVDQLTHIINSLKVTGKPTVTIAELVEQLGKANIQPSTPAPVDARKAPADNASAPSSSSTTPATDDSLNAPQTPARTPVSSLERQTRKTAPRRRLLLVFVAAAAAADAAEEGEKQWDEPETQGVEHQRRGNRTSMSLSPLGAASTSATCRLRPRALHVVPHAGSGERRVRHC